jgi:hypothetical protein
MLATVELLYGTWGRKERKTERQSVKIISTKVMI